MKHATKLGLAVALTVFLVVAGTGVSYALWATTASTSADVKTGKVLLSALGNPVALAFQYSPSALTVAAPVKITNGGTVELDVTVTFIPGATSTLPLSTVTVHIWEATNCAAPVSTYKWSGTLANLPAPIGALASTASTDLCVRTTMDSTVAQAHQGAALAGNLVFTGTNGWVTSANLAVSQSVFEVPALAPPPAPAKPCAEISSNKDVILAWTAATGTSPIYRIYVDPLSTLPESSANPVVTVAVPTAIIKADYFDTIQGTATGTVTVYSEVNGWLSAGYEMTVYFNEGSAGKNAKIYCSIPTK